MKKEKKYLVIFLVLIIIGLSCIQIVSLASSQNIVVSDLSNDLKLIVKRSTYNQLLRGTNELESSYNLKDHLPNIQVKHQKQSGLCWDFAFSSMVETTLSNEKNINSPLYSPMHLEYWATKNFNRKLNSGGNQFMIVPYISGGFGPVLESELPFSSVYDETKFAASNYYLEDPSKVDINKKVNTKINNSIVFSEIYKKYNDNSIKYYKDKDFKTEYTNEEVTAIRKLIKEHIKEHGGIFAGVYIDSTKYYNRDTNSYYYNSDTSDIGNHAITIVGWDDEYKVDNFNSSNRPINPGAYIALNSSGSNFGDSGYFYISYDDAIIETQLLGISDIEQNIDYDKIYQYDVLGCTKEMSYSGVASSYGANVFSRDANTEKDEYISEIRFYTPQAQGIEIYLNAINGDLSKIELVASPGVMEKGYHTVKLPSPIKLTGDKFVVAMKCTNSETGAKLPVEANTEDSEKYNTVEVNKGESFSSPNGSYWEDVSDESKLNICIKAITNFQNKQITDINVTEVTLNKQNTTIKIGETETLTAKVLPENATNKNVTWKSSNEEIATVNGGVITGKKEGKTTITVETEDGKKTATCEVTVEKKQESKISVTGVTLNKQNTAIKIDGTETLTAKVLPENATNKNVTWKSSNEEIATVNGGVITGKKEGKTTITVETEDGKKTATCEVTVKKEQESKISVTGVTLNKQSTTIKIGKTETLSAKVLPENATNENVTWKSSNEEIVTVNGGIITGKKEGKATITVETEDGKKIATCEVTVEKEQESKISVIGVTLNKQSTTIKIGKTETLSAKVLPENATNKNVTWKSSNEEIVIVNGGVITGKKEGKATITAETEDGKKIAICEVTVEKQEEQEEKVSVEGVKLNKNNLTIEQGELFNLVVTITPSNATNKNIKWTSSDDDIATISKNGIIRAVKEGTVIITATSEDGQKIDTCKIVITKKQNADDDIYKVDDSQTNIEKKDYTIAKKVIPQTGNGITGIIAIILVLVLGGIMFIKYRKYKKIK